MAAQDSDSEEDFVTYGKPLEQYQEGEQPKKPIALQDQTVKDEKGRYKRFHGAFTGGFSAGYFNTVGTKEGWTPSTFVSSRQGRSERAVSRPEDFMDEEDLGEFGIAPTEILTTDNFASKSKDRIREKARELASVSAPIPGATILDDLIAPAKITIGIQLLRQMGWKEGQGVGPRTKRRAQKQKPESYVRMYGCALPPAGSEGSEDEEDEYVPENVTFAPKDVIQIDFTMKDNVHGLGYRGLDPSQALFGSQEKHIHLFGDGYEKMNSLLRDNQHSRGRKVGMSGQAFGVGALEEEDDDIYGRESLSKYDTVLCEEESGDGLFGWTAPKEYKNRKGLHKELVYVGKILDGYCTAMKPAAPKKVYAPPELPKDYRPVHYFKPVLNTSNLNSPALQALLNSSQKPPSDAATKQSRHHLNSDQRREMLGETPLQGPSSVLELLSDKDRERIQDVKHAVEQHRIKAQKLAEEAAKQRFQLKSAKETQLQESPQRKELVPAHSGDFRPFEKNPEKQKRYETYVKNFHKGEKDALENCLDRNMTEWEREREREEFMRSAMLYKSSSSTLSSRFTRAKYDDNTDKVEVPRDQESDAGDKSAAVKMKMFGKLTRDTFEWHPDKLLCKRFNIPDPYPGSTIVGLPKVKRDKFSVFNFLTVAENPKTHETNEMLKPCTAENKPKKLSRWDVSGRNQEETASNVNKQIPDQTAKDTNKATSTLPPKIITEQTDQIEDEEKRPSIDLFKAIFEDSSDEKSSSSEEESDAEESSTPITNTQRAEPMNSKAPEPEPEIQQPVLSAAPKVKEVPEVIHPEEEFGPKLPPALPSSASGGNKFTLHPISDESVKKQKHNKRDKEKHKLKKRTQA
ncbi:G patch domain-containing protein 1 [Xenopus tropicalis]|uniref:G patch domain-containing protein 1 n=1 Tax=Xenopus tropicalis TaxID=8364 RepID=B1H130_XENTR|nr:G patch domain-containing protein 1 [Xenopus tropicalis]AAI60447.1 LOC733839 protein [Xenopus tropicalis]|eukprot:NP_001116191.1 G patch domain-containing protein 1 [Xenopus tropicalis]